MARPDKALAKMLFDALLRRKRTLAANLVWVHVPGEGRAHVMLDGLEVRPYVSLVTRGAGEAAEAIRNALEHALKPHVELDQIEAYRQSDEPGVVFRDPRGESYDEPQPLSRDRQYISAGVLQGRFLYELVRTFPPSLCLELGTAYGVSGLYLLAGAPNARLVTIEADPVRRDAALRAFERFGVAQRVTSHLGLFADVLPPVLADIATPLRFVFEDGPHIAEVTLAVFSAVIDRMESGGILVFDDIYHDWGNERAWRQIMGHPEIIATAEVNGRQGVCVKR